MELKDLTTKDARQNQKHFINVKLVDLIEYRQSRGWLVGDENAGLHAMFTMMNNARLGVGIEGL